MKIILKQVSKNYGDRVILEPMTLVFDQEKTTILLGPSGCGKSTLLRMIVGLIQPSDGEIFYDDQRFTPDNAEELRRQVGYVIQDGGLFPHLSAQDNITLQARFFKIPKEAILRKLHELCELVQLPKYMLNHYPKELSGGQKQRVGIMRALMLDPKCVLLDEPLGALDPLIRNELQHQLKQIFADLKKTVIMVTHDMPEAAYLGDEIVIMNEGRVIQRGSYQELAEHPKSDFVNSFLKAQLIPSEYKQEV